MKPEKAESRRTRADRRFERFCAAEPGAARAQAYGSWLELATAGEVRRLWRSWMPHFPGWARKESAI